MRGLKHAPEESVTLSREKEHAQMNDDSLPKSRSGRTAT
jgi:hypothetical protein